MRLFAAARLEGPKAIVGKLHRFLSARLVDMLVASLICLLAISASARPFTVEDMLDMENVGRVTFSPDGTRVWIERQAAYRTATNFDFPFLMGRDRSTILEAGIQGPLVASPAFVQAGGRGYWFGSFSPDGERAAIFWLQDNRLRTGIVNLGSHALTRLPVNPDFEPWLAEPSWVGNDALLYVELAPGEHPIIQRSERRLLFDHPMGPNGRVSGTPAVSVLYSGRTGRNEPAPKGRLVLARADGSTKRSLAEGDFVQVTVSPDGRFAVAVRDASLVKPPAGRPLDHGGQRLRDVLLVDLRSAEPPRVVCSDCDTGVVAVEWSRDSRRLLVFDNGRGRQFGKGLHVLDALGQPSWSATRDIRLEGEWSPLRQKASAATFANGGILVLGRGPDGRDDWFWVVKDRPSVNLTAFLTEVPRRLAAVWGEGAYLIGDGALWFVKSGSAPTLVLDGGSQPLEIIGTNDGFGSPVTPVDPQAIAVRRRGGDGQDMLIFFDASNGARADLAIPFPNPEILAVSMRQHLAVVRVAGDAGIYLLSRKSAPRLLAEVNRHLSDVDTPEIRRLVRKDHNGADVVDWLLLPRNRPAGRTPVATYFYPGRVQNRDQSGYETVAQNLSYTPRLLLKRGVGVLLPSIPLPPQGAGGDPLAQTAWEVSAAVDSAIASGAADSDRLALIGHSFGGYGVLAVLATTSRFKAGVAIAGIANLSSFYGQFDVRSRLDDVASLDLFGSSLMESGQGAMGAPPWQDPERYVRNSPLFQAGKITTPIMLVQGDFDYISMTQGEEMFTALYRQNKDSVFLRYWGEGHLLARPATLIDLDRRIAEWLEHCFGRRSGK